MDVVSEAVAVVGEQIAILSKACDELSHRELIRLLAEVNAVMRSVPAVEHRALARLVAETEPQHLGEASWKKVLTTALRVSGREAARRLVRAKTLGPRRAVGGEPLAPLWEATATAQAQGLLDDEHVSVIATFHKNMPTWFKPGPGSRPMPNWPARVRDWIRRTCPRSRGICWPRSIRMGPRPRIKSGSASGVCGSGLNKLMAIVGSVGG